MNITVVGGGNIGTQFAVHCAEKKHNVTVFTSGADLYDNELTIVDDNGTVTHKGTIKCATSDAVKAFSDAELIIVTYPSTLMRKAAELIFDYADVSAYICAVPGNGGSECAFKKCIERGNIFFAIERVPAIARLIEKGKSVKSTGYRDELHIASIPSIYASKFCDIISGIFDMPCKVIPNFLNFTMTPSNPILHTTRLRTIFKDYAPGVVYKELPLFYENWDNASSELLFKCDDEVQNICKALPEFQLEFVKSLKIHYESPTIEAMTAKISSIPAFKGLKTPSVKVDNGYIPDLHSRYFTADFSYGLTIIKQIADFTGINTPNIDETMKWYENIAIENDSFNFKDYNIDSFADFSKFYLQ